jgi:hypothetical protein
MRIIFKKIVLKLSFFTNKMVVLRVLAPIFKVYERNDRSDWLKPKYHSTTSPHVANIGEILTTNKNK